jgi:polyhydroxyalkanoate synthesis regulator phasin
MVVEAVQNYVNMVSGLSKMTREKASATAKSLLAQAGLEDVAADASGRVAKLAEEILAASRANRELLENLISAEIDKAAGRWGFVRKDDVEGLRGEVAELRAVLANAFSASSATPPSAGRRSAATRPAGKHPAERPATQGPAAKRAAATASLAKKAAGSTAGAKKAAGMGTKKASAKTTGTKKAAAKKSATSVSPSSRIRPTAPSGPASPMEVGSPTDPAPPAPTSAPTVGDES